MPPPQTTAPATRGKRRESLCVALAVIAVLVALAHVPQLTLWHLSGGHECLGIFCFFAATPSALDDADGAHQDVPVSTSASSLSSSSSTSFSPSSSSSSSPSSSSLSGGGGGGEEDEKDTFSPERVAAVAKLLRSAGKDYCSGAPTPWLPMPIHTSRGGGGDNDGGGGGGVDRGSDGGDEGGDASGATPSTLSTSLSRVVDASCSFVVFSWNIFFSFCAIVAAVSGAGAKVEALLYTVGAPSSPAAGSRATVASAAAA